MIPIGLPSIEYVLAWLAFLLATLTWIGWSLGLALLPRLRRQCRRGWLLSYVVLSVISLFTLWKLVSTHLAISAYQAEQQFLFHPTLTEPQHIGQIDMPAGAQLVLSLPRQFDTFRVATFPFPIDIGGVQTLHAERYVSIQTDAHFQSTGFTPETIRLRGIGLSQQDGWICDARHDISFATHSDGRIDNFEHCTLADGNQVDTIALPAGAEVHRTTGTVYLDGRVDHDRWLIHLPNDVATLVQGAKQTGGALFLDAERKLHRRTH